MRRGKQTLHDRSLEVFTRSAGSRRGILRAGNLTFPCALGRTGWRASKREGDGATPMGCWRLERVLYRPDRLRHPRTGLPMRALGPADGWCDAVEDRNYNRPVRHPYPASAEQLWRQDGLYDVVVVLACNTRPRVRGRGSAIFMHVATPTYRPTQGCIALARPHLLRLLERIGRRASVVVGPPQQKRPKRKLRALRARHSWRAQEAAKARWSAGLAAG